MKVPIDSIKFIEELYPRNGFKNEVVNSYRLNIGNLPAIVITHENYLVDGYHRVLAHRLEGLTEIEAEIVNVPKDRVLWEATRLNAEHGLQLSMPEKRRLARLFFRNNACSQKEIAGVLSVSPSYVSEWLRDLVQEAREEQKRQIIDLYLRCLTYEEIGKKLNLTKGRISQIVTKFRKFISEEIKPPESLQFFNVWNFPHRREVLDFNGAIPREIIENVLYYYTKPFDLVVDPMVGSGTTIDVCRAMYRRYRTYDINPLRLESIMQHDIREGYPSECKNCDLIFLDPPYHNMVFDNFKSIVEFYEFIEKLARESYKTVKEEGVVAFLMQDMTEKGQYCLSGESYRYFIKAKFVCIDHISCPLSTQQFNAQQIEKSKEQKHLLGRNRDLYIFKKDG